MFVIQYTSLDCAGTAPVFIIFLAFSSCLSNVTLKPSLFLSEYCHNTPKEKRMELILCTFNFTLFYLLFQALASGVFLLAGLIAGAYHQQMALIAHKRTCDSTKTCLESRVKLECEKEQQEQLLLSVIPAYIAAEVRHKYFPHWITAVLCIWLDLSLDSYNYCTIVRRTFKTQFVVYQLFVEQKCCCPSICPKAPLDNYFITNK